MPFYTSPSPSTKVIAKFTVPPNEMLSQTMPNGTVAVSNSTNLTLHVSVSLPMSEWSKASREIKGQAFKAMKQELVEDNLEDAISQAVQMLKGGNK